MATESLIRFKDKSEFKQYSSPQLDPFRIPAEGMVNFEFGDDFRPELTEEEIKERLDTLAQYSVPEEFVLAILKHYPRILEHSVLPIAQYYDACQTQGIELTAEEMVYFVGQTFFDPKNAREESRPDYHAGNVLIESLPIHKNKAEALAEINQWISNLRMRVFRIVDYDGNRYDETRNRVLRMLELLCTMRESNDEEVGDPIIATMAQFRSIFGYAIALHGKQSEFGFDARNVLSATSFKVVKFLLDLALRHYKAYHQLVQKVKVHTLDELTQEQLDEALDLFAIANDDTNFADEINNCLVPHGVEWSW